MSADTDKKQPPNLSLVKGFIAGVIFSHINKVFVLSAVVGVAGGMWVEQNISGVPNVKQVTSEWIRTFKKTISKKED